MPAAFGIDRSGLVVGVMTFALGTAGAAFAQSAPAFTMTWDATGDLLPSNTYDPASFGSVTNNGDGSFNYNGSLLGPDNAWSLTWDCDVDADPFVIANIVVTNNTAATQTFSLLMNLPISPALPNTIMSGSVSGTVTDNTFGAGLATVAAPVNDSIYTALINNIGVMSLLNGTSVTVGGNFQSAPVGPEAFANTPGPGLADGDLIGIELIFTLTAGDSASFTSIFEVVVPAPAALPLLMVVGLAGSRRRR